MKRKVELNADIGEGMPWDEALLDWITAANVGCGVHAGSFDETLRVASLCREREIKVGAHPGYPDREEFGRKSPKVGKRREWAKSVIEQLEAMSRAIQLDYVKPHGALYHDLLHPKDDYFVAGPMKSWLRTSGLPLLGLANSPHQWIADWAGVRFIAEGFSERGYNYEGNLIARGEVGAELKSLDQIVAQSLNLARTVDSLCIHGDREGCVDIARVVRIALIDAGYSE